MNENIYSHNLVFENLYTLVCITLQQNTVMDNKVKTKVRKAAHTVVLGEERSNRVEKFRAQKLIIGEKIDTIANTLNLLIDSGLTHEALMIVINFKRAIGLSKSLIVLIDENNFQSAEGDMLKENKVYQDFKANSIIDNNAIG